MRSGEHKMKERVGAQGMQAQAEGGSARARLGGRGQPFLGSDLRRCRSELMVTGGGSLSFPLTRVNTLPHCQRRHRGTPVCQDLVDVSANVQETADDAITSKLYVSFRPCLLVLCLCASVGPLTSWSCTGLLYAAHGLVVMLAPALR
jgi:hypothetical protein